MSATIFHPVSPDTETRGSGAQMNFHMVIGGFTSTATPGEFLPQLPASFIEALEDFESGRVVDMETALNEPPPPDA